MGALATARSTLAGVPLKRLIMRTVRAIQGQERVHVLKVKLVVDAWRVAWGGNARTASTLETGPLWATGAIEGFEGMRGPPVFAHAAAHMLMLRLISYFKAAAKACVCVHVWG